MLPFSALPKDEGDHRPIAVGEVLRRLVGKCLTQACGEEARALLSSYEKKQKDVQEQSERIVSQAKAEAEAVAQQAKADLKDSIARRLVAAQDQIASAEAQALRAVREQAVTLAVAAAGDVLSKQMTSDRAAASIDMAIAQVDAKFH